MITSNQNQFCKLYRKICTLKSERKAAGLFPIEGHKLLEEAVREELSFELCLATESEAVHLNNSCLPVQIISNEIARSISITETPQGVFALCKIPSHEFAMTKSGKYIVLYEVRDPGNIGTVIRTADAFGLDGVILCKSAEAYNPKIVRSAMGSLFRTNLWETDTIDGVFKLLSANNITTNAASLRNAVDMKTLNFSGGQAVFIGNEGSGLPDEISNKCDRRFTIKMNGHAESLNAAMAAGIILHHIIGG